MFDHRPACDLSYTVILRVCRQMHKEALTTVMRAMSKSLKNIDHLANWTSSPHAHLLHHWGSVSLAFEEDSLRELRSSILLESPQVFKSTNPWTARYEELVSSLSLDIRAKPLASHWYEHDSRELVTTPRRIETVASALSAFHTIKDLNLFLGLTWRFRAPVKPNFSLEYQLILEIVAASMKDLQRLDIRWIGDAIPLDFLTHLPNLRRLCMRGYTLSTPSQTQEIFQNLIYLEELQIWATEDVAKDSFASISPSLVERLPRLKVFEVYQTAPTSAFISIAMLSALSAHRHSLERFILDWEDEEQKFGPEKSLDAAVFEEVVNFVASLEQAKTLRLTFRLPVQYEGFEISPLLPASLTETTCRFRFADYVQPRTNYYDKIRYES